MASRTSDSVIALGRNMIVAVMVLVGLFYLALLPTMLRHLNPVTGDEPFYIMTATSLVRDRDLDETNNYANRDYESFYPDDPLPADWQGWPAFPRTLPPHPAISEQPGLYSKHGLGVSLLIAVPYELAGRVGAVLVMIVCAILLAGQMYLVAHEAGAKQELAALIAVGLAIAMPLAPYGPLIFPEVPAALLIIYALRRLTSAHNQLWQWLATGAAIGFLPWLHQRFAVMSAVFAVVLLVRVWRERSVPLAAALVLVAAGGFSLLTYNQWLYGQLTQNVEDHAGFSGLTGTVNGAAGLLLDAQWGLLIVAPFVIFGLAAIPFWIRTSTTRASLALAATAPYLIVVAAYQVWWGEWGPPGRYLVPIVPFLAGALGAWVSHSTLAQRIVTSVLWVFGMMLTLVGFAQPQRFYHHPDGTNNLYRVVGDTLGFDLADRLAAFQPYASDSFMTRLVWTTGMLLVLIVVTYWVNIRLTDAESSPQQKHAAD